MKTLKTALIVSILLLGTAHAQTAAKPGMDTMTMAGMVDGEVRKVDKVAKKITLKHGEIRSLEMPGMTMMYQVRDAAILDKVKTGDKVRFMAEKSGGVVVVTAIQLVK